MTMQDNVELQRARGIYLLPNFFTTAGLFAGFYAIVAAMNMHYHGAAVAIFVAMLMDCLDGRVARLTNTQSAFGAEYDSLSDMVSFGIAPALVSFSWAMHGLGKLGWLAAFLFAAAGALRLARFNTQLTMSDKRYFQGLSITASAGVVAGMVWAAHQSGISGPLLAWPVAITLTVLAILMVSNIRYHSFKQIDLRGNVPFVAILVLVLAFVLVALDPPHILFFIFTAYALSGPLLTLWNLQKAKRLRYKAALAKKTKQQP
jgi:CDP-diacylglycerol--serine O-phosphatidyltransferase